MGGYASPIGLDPRKVRVVADPSVRSGRNFVSGANRPDYHIENVNVPRDFSPGEWADLARVDAGDPCPHCGAALEIEAGVRTGAERSRPPASTPSTWTPRAGASLCGWRAGGWTWAGCWPPSSRAITTTMACSGPLPVRRLTCTWSALDLRREEVAAQAEALYRRLQAEGLAVLYDDRDASAGVKFNDADLIGLPLRLTVSKRSAAEGLIEAKWRDSRERLKLDDAGLAAELAARR